MTPSVLAVISVPIKRDFSHFPAWVDSFAAGICLAVETSQLIHAEWLENLRSHRIVALLIGRGFLWIDLVRYALGLVIAMGLDRVLGPGPRAAPGRSRSTPKR